MSLADQIELRLGESLKKKDEASLSLFRMLKSAIKNAEIEKRSELDEVELISILERQAKQRRDSIEQFAAGARMDLAKKEQFELEIIESFLPQKMSEEEIRKIVKEKITSMPEAQFGQVMGAIMSELKGRADGQVVQKIVKEETSG